ncbi:Uncharacterised protein [Providencia alcalifaciens]|nr:Uncharacterised protein [Providencia alcalifaciens]
MASTVFGMDQLKPHFTFMVVSFAEMEAILRPLLDANPLCEKCRVVQTA